MKTKQKHVQTTLQARLAAFRRGLYEIYGKHRLRDPELLKAYVGRQYPKIATRWFSFPGFFFSSLYMFYRKMRWSAIIVFAVQIGLIVVTKSLVLQTAVPNFALDLILQLLISLLVGCFVNKFYLWDAEHKIAILKQRFPHATSAELKGICMARGGTSVAVAVPWVVLEVLISVIIAAAMLVGEILSGESPSLENFQQQIEEAIEAGTELNRERSPLKLDF